MACIIRMYILAPFIAYNVQHVLNSTIIQVTCLQFDLGALALENLHAL